MKLVLVRHGRPEEGDAVANAHDPGLDADGRRQAEAVATLLAAQGVTHVVSSPLRRAVQTAEPLAARLRVPVDVVDGWAEADRDRSVYRSLETLRAQGDAEWSRFLTDPVRYLGADPARFREDVQGALASVVGKVGPRDHVAVFTHGLPINLVLSRVLGLERIVHFRPAYGSITRLLAHDASRLDVVSVNETGHHAWPQPLEP